MEQFADKRGVNDAQGGGLVPNHIAQRRKRMRIPARQIADLLEGVSLPIFSTIENGRVMPKKADLKIICGMLRCGPTDLYPADQLMLAQEDVAPTTSQEAVSPAPTDRGHKGQVEFRTWLRLAERQTLRDTVMALGYRNEAEWFREMYRNTLARHKRIENRASK